MIFKAFALFCVLSVQLVHGSEWINVEVDFNDPAYFPLLKGKASIFQEGLADSPSQEEIWDRLASLKIRTFRPLLHLDHTGGKRTGIFEKNNQINIRKATGWEEFIDLAHSQRVLPMLTLWGTPAPFQISDSNRNVNIAPPSDLESYTEAVVELASLYRGKYPILWEIWNEPQGAGFLDSLDKPSDYNQIFNALAPALKLADPDFLVVGPAMANEESVIEEFSRRFVANLNENKLPIDYYSIHSYGRFPREFGKRKIGFEDRTAGLVEHTRRHLSDDFQTVPIVLTEYEHYPAGPNVPQHRLRELPIGAVKFLVDLDYFLEQTDIPFVTWNRCIRNGPRGRHGGLLNFDLRLHPIYHALNFYGEMPTERVQLTLDQEHKGLDGFASSDATGAGLMLWNDSGDVQKLELDLRGLPQSGTCLLYRIDKDHGNVHGGTSDDCQPVASLPVDRLSKPIRLKIPYPGILYLKYQTEESSTVPTALRAKYIRSWQWAGRTPEGTVTGDYGDFDWRTWTARTGVLGDTGRGLCGVTIEDAPSTILVDYELRRSLASHTENSLFGVRVDYVVDGSSQSSVLTHGGMCDVNRTSSLPWASGGCSADKIIEQDAEHSSFLLALDQHAPAAWKSSSQRRVIVSFWMEDTGPESQAIFRLFNGPDEI